MEKKKTYITIHFYSHAERSETDRFSVCMNKDRMDPEDIHTIRELLEKNDTLQSARIQIQERISDALQCIENLKSTRAKENLRLLSLHLRDRVS
jgi:geranylgeranyl pyrophosphate synthase